MPITKDSGTEELYGRLEELRKDFAELPEPERRSAADSDRLRRMVEEVGELDARIAIHSAVERRDALKRSVPPQNLGVGGGVRSPSFGQRLVESTGFKSWEERGITFGNKGAPGLHVELDGRVPRPLETRAGIGEWGTSGPSLTFPNQYDGSDAGMMLPLAQPVAPRVNEARLYLRDLIPHIPVKTATVPYVRELNPTSTQLTSASAIPQNTQLPSAALAFDGAIAPVTTIVTSLPLAREIFEDSEMLVAYLNARLPYVVRVDEDYLFLQGNGAFPNLTGILNTPGLQVVASGSSGSTQDIAIAIGNGFAAIENANGRPTAVVLNPTDAWGMFTNRAAGGSGTFDAGTPYSALPLTVWGVPSYRTSVQPQGQSLVGDFGMGALVADRQGVTVEVYEQTLAQTNQVLLTCRERVGLLVNRPDLFVQVTGL